MRSFLDVLISQAAKDLYRWQQGKKSFYSGLFFLLSKATDDQYSKLSHAFPVHALAWEMFARFDSPEEFYEYYRVEDKAA